jgi:hypothetical protein
LNRVVVNYEQTGARAGLSVIKVVGEECRLVVPRSDREPNKRNSQFEDRNSRVAAIFEFRFSNFGAQGLVTRYFRTPQREFKNMNIYGPAAGFSRPRRGAQILISLWGLALLFAIRPQSVLAQQDAPAPPQAAPAGAPALPYTQGTPEQLQQLVAPIALYPDSLVAQILAASTFPEQYAYDLNLADIAYQFGGHVEKSAVK